jgi:hypothetical protein
MTAQNHESIKTLISALNITRYQDSFKTQLDETRATRTPNAAPWGRAFAKSGITERDLTIGTKAGK